MNSKQDTDDTRVGTVGRIILGSNRLAVPIGAVILLVICGILWQMSPNHRSRQLEEAKLQNAILSANPAMLTRPSTPTTGITQTLSLYYIQLGDSKQSDIFRVTYTRTVAGKYLLGENINQTQSSTTGELWPVLSPDGETLAYFAVNAAGERDLYTQPVDSKTKATNLTKNAASSGLHRDFEIKLDQPPKWSEGGQWLLFLAEQTDGKGDTIRLYVVKMDTGQVLPQKTEGAQVLWAAWQNRNDLLYLTHRPDGRFALYTQSLFNENATFLGEVNLPESNE